jgi:membrane protein required for colicin V production
LEDISIFDIIIVSLITLLGLKGLFRGFIKEFFALFGIVGGVFVASRLSVQVGELVDKIVPFDNNNTMVLVGFVVTVVVFWVLAYLVGMALSKVFDLSGLGIFNRILGFVFGAGKIFLLFSIIVFATSQIEVINKKLNDKLSSSIALPILKQTGAYIIKLDTTKLQSGVSKRVNSAVQTTKDAIEDISTDVIKDKVKQIKKELKD